MKREDLQIRVATADDVAQIVELLWDDPVGRTRETRSPNESGRYHDAFARIERDPNSTLLVASHDRQVMGCVQMTIIPGLSYRGTSRCLIEDLRVAKQWRGQGIGQQLLAQVETMAQSADCGLIELFVHEERSDAHRFYEREGFVGVHRGFRKKLD